MPETPDPSQVLIQVVRHAPQGLMSRMGAGGFVTIIYREFYLPPFAHLLIFVARSGNRDNSLLHASSCRQPSKPETCFWSRLETTGGAVRLGLSVELRRALESSQ